MQYCIITEHTYANFVFQMLQWALGSWILRHICSSISTVGTNTTIELLWEMEEGNNVPLPTDVVMMGHPQKGKQLIESLIQKGQENCPRQKWWLLNFIRKDTLLRSILKCLWPGTWICWGILIWFFAEQLMFNCYDDSSDHFRRLK